VRHAAGELTDRFHLLRLTELILERSPLGDVAYGDDDGGDRGIGEAIDADALHDAPAAVRVFEPHFGADRRARLLQRFAHPDSRNLPVVGMQEVEDRTADHVLGFPPEMALGRRGDVAHAAFMVDEQQRIRTVLDQRPEALLACTQGGFGLPALAILRRDGKRVANGAIEGFNRDVRLAQVVRGAGLHRVHSDFLGAPTGEHDDRCVDAVRPDVAQQRQSIPGAEPVVEEGDVERFLLHQAQRLIVGADGLEGPVPPRLAHPQEFRHHLGMLERVVDDQDAEMIGHTVS
jgi:hypothetical protein